MAATAAPTILWARRPELAEAIRETHTNPDYLPEFRLPETLEVTSELEEAVAGADVVIMAVPSHGFRQVFSGMVPHIATSTAVLSLTKGIEEETLATMTRVVAEEAPDHDPAMTGVLTGPNLVREVVERQPTAAVIAMSDQDTARNLQSLFMSPSFRVYTNDDVVGCELGGALKNVMAIASGMSDGLGFGNNTRAALLTRALAELTRLGVALGGKPATFAGLAGMGDLVATCISPLSRNHRVGMALSEGKPLDQVISEMRMVAEGVKTTRSVMGLAERTGVEIPIAAHVYRVLYEGLHPREAVLSLMTRAAKSELG
jgi:glycerol-3-phosphate dehydrogenase (NAD(P)+)